MKGFVLFLLLGICCLVSCQRQVALPEDMNAGKEYTPLQIGKYIEYEVDSMRYNNFSLDTEYAHLSIRDEVSDTFTDNLGRLSYFIRRFARYSDTASWDETSSYYATLSGNRLEVVENNLRFIKMVFPVKVNTVWDGNIYLPASASSQADLQWYLDWTYTYKGINTAFDNGIMDFPNTVTVQASIGPLGTGLINDSTSTVNYSEFTAYKEVYANHLGMIYRYVTHWEFQPTEGFRNGFSVVFRAKNYN